MVIIRVQNMNKKVKVLLTAFNHLDVGGIQKMIMTLVDNLKDRVEFDIIVFSSKEGFYEESFRKQGKVFHCPHYEGKNLILSKMDYYIRYKKIKMDVMKVIAENGPYDAFHTNAFFESAPCLDAAYRMGIPIRIAHSHNTGTKDTRPFPIRTINKLYRWVYRSIINKYATDCVGCSDAARQYLFGDDKGYVIYNCVDSGSFTVSHIRYWKELRLINVGNFVEQKNQLFLIEIFKELVEIEQNCHLTMIGRITPYLDKVTQKIQEYGLTNKISILPSDSNISSAMNESDYFILPSRFEGLPLVLLEAQKSGLHCFASSTITKECDCGLVSYLAIDDAKKWASAILQHYSQCGPNKYSVEMKKFDTETYINSFLEIYSREKNL